MEHRTVRRKFQDWSDKRLTTGERHGVEGHLDGCDECRTYYEKMSLVFEKTDPARLPRLAPDPFLPSRIRALVEGRREDRVHRRTLAWLRLSAVSIMLILAATAGVYLGRGLSTTGGTTAETDIAQAYYEAFSPSDFSGVWETLMTNADTNDSNGSNEGNR
jgi:predicted anti-sigma-YlaC factor YlaD